MTTSAAARRRLFALPRAVWLLGWVSFFTDLATEMVYPLLPLFLTRVIGASALSLGIIEGIADAANSALKVGSGWLADRTGAPKRIVIAGYGLSSAARPLIAVAAAWPQVLGIRFVDRLGKGIRGAPRDAMLAGFAPEGSRGRVYGFHRAMDHAGAVVGPLIAAAFLFFYPGAYRTLFALTIVPGAVVMLILLRVPEQPAPPPATLPADAPAPGRERLPRSFYHLMGIILLFSLGNATDAFLLLRLSDVGVPAFWIPLLWSGLHVVKVLSSVAGGALSDVAGRRTMIGAGWLCYAAVYAGFGMFTSPAAVIGLFLAYGLYFGLTEGVEKAWVADLAPVSVRGTAFGIYNAVLGAGTLAASLLFGVLWTRVSPAAAFYTGASLAVAATLLLYSPFSHAQNSRHQ